jgi:hypothetical protein
MNKVESPVVSATPAESPAPTEVPAADVAAIPFRDNFTAQQLKFVAAKYAAKYSEADQKEHAKLWPSYVGDSFTMYVLAETLNEAKNAIFSKNRPDAIRDVLESMRVFTPTVHGAVLTDRQVRKNVDVKEELLEVAASLENESQRIAVLKDVRKHVKLDAGTGKDTDTARAKFWYVCDIFGIIPQTIW